MAFSAAPIGAHCYRQLHCSVQARSAQDGVPCQSKVLTVDSYAWKRQRRSRGTHLRCQSEAIPSRHKRWVLRSICPTENPSPSGLFHHVTDPRSGTVSANESFQSQIPEDTV